MISIISLFAACGGVELVDEPPGVSILTPAVFPETLVYASSEQGVAWSQWEPGQALRVTVDGADLRAEPRADSALVRSLPMGGQVVIEEVSSGEETQIELRNRWYRVQTPDGATGHLFGAVLTPFALSGDLDGDGEQEMLTASFSPEFQPRLRVLETEVPAEADWVVTLDLLLSEGRDGGTLKMQRVDTGTNLWGAVRIDLCKEEACRSELVAYLLGPRSRLGHLVALPAEPDKVTFVDGGFNVEGQTAKYRLINGAFTSATCPECDQAVSLIPLPEPQLRLDENVSVDIGQDGPSYEEIRLVCHTLGRVGEGQLAGKPVIDCAFGPGPGWARLVEDSSHFWLLYEEGGPPTPFFIRNTLPLAGITLEERTLYVRGASAPQEIWKEGWGSFYHLSLYTEVGWSSSGRTLAFEHPLLGPVYADKGPKPRFYAPQGPRTFAYSHAFRSWTLQTEPGESDRLCAEDLVSYWFAPIEDEDLVPLVQSNAGTLYTLAQRSHPAYLALQEEHKAKVPFKEFFSRNIFFWRDPQGFFLGFHWPRSSRCR